MKGAIEPSKDGGTRFGLVTQRIFGEDTEMDWVEYRPPRKQDFISADLMIAWIKESLIYRKVAIAETPEFLEQFDTVEDW